MDASTKIVDFVIPLVEISEFLCDLFGTSSRPIRLLAPSPWQI